MTIRQSKAISPRALHRPHIDRYAFNIIFWPVAEGLRIEFCAIKKNLPSTLIEPIPKYYIERFRTDFSRLQNKLILIDRDGSPFCSRSRQHRSVFVREKREQISLAEPIPKQRVITCDEA